MKTPIRLGVFAAVLIMSLVLAACGSAEPDAATATATSGSLPAGASPSTAVTPRPSPTLAPTGTVARPAASPTPIPSPAPAIGTTVETDGWDLTVTGYDLYGRVGDHQASGIYLYVRMTITNTADQPRAFPFDGLVVTDVDGNSYFLAADATHESLQYDLNFPFDQQVAPGQQQQVAAVFDIPESATSLRLTTPSRVFEVRLEYQQPTK
jgi:hypothetical protein